MGRMDPISYGPTERHLWLAAKIPPRSSENCRETSDRKARMQAYHHVMELLIELAMERENDSHMDKYLRKHLRSETAAEHSPEGRPPQPKSHPGKCRGGQLKHTTEIPPSKVKGAASTGNLTACRLLGWR